MASIPSSIDTVPAVGLIEPGLVVLNLQVATKALKLSGAISSQQSNMPGLTTPDSKVQLLDASEKSGEIRGKRLRLDQRQLHCCSAPTLRV